MNNKKITRIAKPLTAIAIAQEIVRQLGGNRFLSMTGAKNLIADGNTLSFRLPGKGFSKYNYVKITLNSMDTYDIEFGNINGMNYKKIDVKMIYNEELTKTIERYTGLRLSL